MKTASITLNKEDIKWYKVSTLFKITLEENKTYAMQARQGGLEISLGTSEPTGKDFITVESCEKFAFTFDGTNELWIRPQIVYNLPITIVIS